MNDLPENELFSAYLDGELTAAEQAAVEQLLAQNPAARQLMDELRVLSTTLQTLPVHKLPDDLGQQVLRVAERRMLAEPAESAANLRSGPGAEPSGEEPVGEPPVWRMILRRAVRPRNLLWPAIAVAAAVMIMVMNSDRLPRGERGAGENRVAMAPKDGPRTEEPTIGPAAGAEKEAARRFPKELLREEPGGVEGMVRDHAAKKSEGLSETARDLAGRDREATAAKPSEAASAPLPAGPPPLVAKALKAPGDTFGMKATGDESGKGRSQEFGMAKEGAPIAEKSVQPAETLGKKAEGPLVVLCAVTPEAVRLGAFERIVKLGVEGKAAEKAKGIADQAKESADEAKGSEERILDVELTQTQLNDVLDNLRKEPLYFPFIVENPTLDYLAPGKAEEKQLPGVIGKGIGSGAAGVGARQMNAFPDNSGQAARQTAPLQTPGVAQPGLQQNVPAAQSTYGVPVSQWQMPAGQGLGTGGGGFGGGMGGAVGGMRQPGPGAGAAQPGNQMDTQRGRPAAEPSVPAQVQQRSPAGGSEKRPAAQVQTEELDRLDAIILRSDPDRQLQPGGPAGSGGRRAARSGAASEPGVSVARQKAEAMRVQAPTPAPGQAPRSEALPQQQEETEAKRRVLFVLREIPGISSPETIAKQEPAAKANAARAAAAPAKTAPGK